MNTKNIALLIALLLMASGCASAGKIFSGMGNGLQNVEYTRTETLNCTKDAAPGAYYCQ